MPNLTIFISETESLWWTIAGWEGGTNVADQTPGYVGLCLLSTDEPLSFFYRLQEDCGHLLELVESDVGLVFLIFLCIDY